MIVWYSIDSVCLYLTHMSLVVRLVLYRAGVCNLFLLYHHFGMLNCLRILHLSSKMSHSKKFKLQTTIAWFTTCSETKYQIHKYRLNVSLTESSPVNPLTCNNSAVFRNAVKFSRNTFTSPRYINSKMSFKSL